jgi:hypothetical protein
VVTVVANSADSHGQSSDQEGADSGTASRVDRYMEVFRQADNIFVPMLSASHLSTDTAAHASDPCANAPANRLSEKNVPVICLSITSNHKLTG